MLVLQDQESARMHIVKLMNNLVKGPKRMMTKVQKIDLHESIWQPVVNRDKSRGILVRPDVKLDTCHELKQGPVGCRLSNTRQLGCVFQDTEPPKSILRKSSDMQKPIQRVKFTKALVER